MKQKKKILYISQEITPYLPETDISIMGRRLPETMLEQGNDVRIFMPRFGTINERRHQLHEVIRLSGMNVIIDDTDHALMLKVASLQPSRLQVYFIDNEEYFQRKFMTTDQDGVEFGDNDERSIFFVRSVLETVKKLRWTPDIIHCQGWMSAIAPMYIKKAYNQDPFFSSAKVVYSILNDDYKVSFRQNFANNLIISGVKKEHLAQLAKKQVDFVMLSKFAIQYSDAVVLAAPDINGEVLEHLNQSKIKYLPFTNDYVTDYQDFYNAL
ncbi:MAG: glycogen/starch synthase [Paludibacter sp.]|jgi:starch synthase|nr:glycogen/starch synthase [Paludibacter sp.]